MSKYERLIFVCTGNTCRSPMAEAIYHGMVSEELVEVCSRGLVVLFPEPTNQKADVVMKNHNLVLENHVSMQLKKEELTDKTLVLCMTMVQKLKIMEEYGFLENVYSIKEFVGEEGDVLDPYGGSVLEYEDCFKELSRLMKKTIIKLHEEVLE
ncbi:arsenate reductase/protein-tyrosine-phosphatase family protein [Anaeromicropila populeti]|nr:phosphotyrosine protein phosphatase [Anaeromicropila populeti]